MSDIQRVGIAKESRRQQNLEALGKVEKWFEVVLEALRSGIENDTIEQIDAPNVRLQTIDITEDTDEWRKHKPGPWRSLEIKWAQREVQP